MQIAQHQAKNRCENLFFDIGQITQFNRFGARAAKRDIDDGIGEEKIELESRARRWASRGPTRSRLNQEAG